MLAVAGYHAVVCDAFILDLIVFVYALCYGFGRIKFVYIQRYIVIFNKMLV